MFKDRISALPLNAGGGLPSARAAARSCQIKTYQITVDKLPGRNETVAPKLRSDI